MKLRFIKMDRSTAGLVIILLLLCIATVAGLSYIAEQGRSKSYYLTGKVVSADDDNFCITVLPDKSHIETNFPEGKCCFEMDEFQSVYTVPEIGDTVRIPCSPDLTVLFGVYGNAEELPD